MRQRHLSAGVGRVEITPPLTAPIAGWGAQLHVLPDGVEQELVATVLVVSDGEETAAFCELELVVISREESAAIQTAVAGELGVKTEHVRVSISHNHNGPPPSAWNWVNEGLDALEAYYALLPFQVAGAAREAKLDMRPAHLGWGKGECFMAVNRRETAPDGRAITGVNQGGPIDPEVLVVRIDDVDADPIAAIVGYTMHPTFLGPTNKLLSPDWPGHMRRVFEQATGAVCLFAQGAAGDIGPGPKGFTDRIDHVRAIGGQVGAEAAKVWFGIDVPPVHYEHERIWESGASLGKWKAVPDPEPEPVVRALTTTIELPLRPQMPVEEAQVRLDEIQAKMTRLKAEGAPDAEIEAATFATKRANMRLTRSQSHYGKASTPVDLHLLQIGPVVFAGCEGEPFSATGKAIKAASPFPATWFSGYTGGWAGYVPTKEEFLRGGYEVETSPFTEDAADALARGTIAALNELARLDGETGGAAS